MAESPVPQVQTLAPERYRHVYDELRQFLNANLPAGRFKTDCFTLLSQLSVCREAPADQRTVSAALEQALALAYEAGKWAELGAHLKSKTGQKNAVARTSQAIAEARRLLGLVEQK